MESLPRGASRRWSIALFMAFMLPGCGGQLTFNGLDVARAPLVTADIELPADSFAATLTGAQEVPPVSTLASATGVLMLDPVTSTFTATLVSARLAGTAAHIHAGRPGVAGPIVFPLSETAPGSQVWSTSATLTVQQLADLNAGNYYFNIHSAAFPNGEIRGQLGRQRPPSGAAAASASAPVTWVNVLTAAQEVPPRTSAASGIGIGILDPATRTFTAAVTTRGISGTEAHIHQGLAGIAGPIVFPLTESAAGSGIWTTSVALTETRINALQTGNFYFNVHSAAFPNGEIRAQIVRTAGATPTSGTTSIGTPGFDTSGNTGTGFFTGAM